MAKKEKIYLATGRRKSSIARVRLRAGSGKMNVNGRPVEEFFPIERLRNEVRAPFQATGTEGSFDLEANLQGGGKTGGCGALTLAIARALKQVSEDYEQILREAKYMTRDSRVKERKKYGQRGARRGFQFSKR